MPPHLTVAIAEDHPVFRRQLVTALELDPDLDVVAEADDLGTLVPRLRVRPAVVVVDASSPAGDGARALGRATALGLNVVAMLGPADDPLAPIAAGASSAVTKVDLVEHGPALLRAAAGGVPVLDASVVRALLEAAGQRGVVPSPAQAEALRPFVGGEAVIEVAARLDRGPADVRDAVAAAIMDLRAAAVPARRTPLAAMGPDGPPPSRQ